MKTGASADVAASLASGNTSPSVANSCFDYSDGTSGMGTDPDAWVRRPAIVYAVSSGNLSLLRVLLASPLVDPNHKSPDDGVSALGRASWLCSKLGDGSRISLCQYSVDFLEELLKHPRIDVNNTNDEGSTALMMAAWVGNVLSAPLLLARDTSPRPSSLRPPRRSSRCSQGGFPTKGTA